MRVSGLAIGLLLITAHASAATCSNPRPGLAPGQPDVDAESIPFSNSSRSYALDIYSGFAAQYSSPQANWCLRYEAEHSSQDAIERFDWPLAGMQMDVLEPGDRQSKASTAPPGKPPSLGDTKISAFKSALLRSRAYQATSNPLRD